MALTKVIGRGLGVQGDTVAGDDAALGFTSTEGLIITGQGSTNDITIKNDADAQVCAVPTGTDDLRFPDAAQLQLGTGGDFKLYHDGSNNIVLGNGSHPMAFYTNDVLRQTIDANGHITQPYQPAFSAHKNGSAQTNLATGTDVTITFGTERFDNNSDFASNTFTAPVTGKYFLSVTLYLNQVDSGANYIILGIETSNQQYRTIIDNNDLFGNDADYHHMTSTALVDMDASDTAHVMVHQSGGAAQLDVNGSANYTYFPGYLVA